MLRGLVVTPCYWSYRSRRRAVRVDPTPPREGLDVDVLLPMRTLPTEAIVRSRPSHGPWALGP